MAADYSIIPEKLAERIIKERRTTEKHQRYEDNMSASTPDDYKADSDGEENKTGLTICP